MVDTAEAIENAQRLLQAAEMVDPDVAKMERYNALADSWIELAALLHERERV